LAQGVVYRADALYREQREVQADVFVMMMMMMMMI
jgi:hypothetical protein